MSSKNNVRERFRSVLWLQKQRPGMLQEWPLHQQEQRPEALQERPVALTTKKRPCVHPVAPETALGEQL